MSVDSQHQLQDNTNKFSNHIEQRFRMVDEEIKKNTNETVKKITAVKDHAKQFQKEVEMRFMDDSNKIQLRATYDDIAVIKTDML